MTDTLLERSLEDVIIGDRRVSHVSIGREMLACTKSVHPGVRSLWEFHQAGDPRAGLACIHPDDDFRLGA